MKLLMRSSKHFISLSSESSAGVDGLGTGVRYVKGQWTIRDELKTVVSFGAGDSVKISRTLHGVFIGARWSTPSPVPGAETSVHSYNSM